ncbi:MAG: MarR family transcriptional regulator [Acidobacteria bacterium]|nr:MarR family transcriptional regulator [Acidobacteriota bacterium]
MAVRRPSAKRTLAARAWRRLFDFFISTRHERDATLERFRLTPNDSKALSTLDPTEGKPMSALAAAWGTDASNATWVVDRLERLGLAQRRTIATDRRVKLVVLTSRGLAARDEIMSAFREPPAGMLALESRDLRALDDILSKLTPDATRLEPSSGYGSPMATRRSGRRRSAGRTPPAGSNNGA